MLPKVALASIPEPGDIVTVFQHPECDIPVKPGKYRLRPVGLELPGLKPNPDGSSRLWKTPEMERSHTVTLRLSTLIELNTLDGKERTFAPRCCIREFPPVVFDREIGDTVTITARFPEKVAWMDPTQHTRGEASMKPEPDVRRVKVTIIDKQPMVVGYPDEGNWNYEIDLLPYELPHWRPHRQMPSETLMAMYEDEEFGTTYRTSGWRKFVDVETMAKSFRHTKVERLKL